MKVVDIKSERGKFRSMDMELLRATSDDPIWESGPSKLIYSLPIRWSWLLGWKARKLTEGNPVDELYKIGKFNCAKSPHTHIGPFKWAIDFLVPDGTTILAAQDGVLIEVQEECNRWGDGEEFRDFLNFLTIRHAKGENTQYCHLAQHSVQRLGLVVGSRVKQGQPIAKVGKTGWTDRDHLHFAVYQSDPRATNPFGFLSVVPRFE